MSDQNLKPTRGRPKTMKLDDVLDIAMNAYWKSDPADVSINAICKMAGISKPSLYREFGNEDGFNSATLERYAGMVLSDVFAILESKEGMSRTLERLVDFVCCDPRMETGCLFYKMRAGKHRLGPLTRAKVDNIDAAAQLAYEDFLQSCRDAGEWQGPMPTNVAARYLGEQVALAITQRASGVDPADVREQIMLALSVFPGQAEL